MSEHAALDSADERLAQSRAALRLAMSDPAADGGIGMDALGSWWRRSPLRLATNVAAEAADAWVQPIAQKHPLRLVGGALLAGGALAWSKPWRWLPRQALWAALLPQVLKVLGAAQPRRH